MGVVGRLDQYASMLCNEFDETTANNPSITGLGTYYASEFSENFVVGIVTSGLVFNVDAGNTASYPGIGNTWTDLISGTQVSLINSPTYNSANSGFLVFNGSNQRATYPNTAYTLGSTFSIEVWSYWASPTPPASNPFTGCMYTNSALADWNTGTGSNSGLLLGFNSIYYRSSGIGETTGTWTASTQQWHHYVITINNGTGYVYFDTNQVYTATNFRTTYSTAGTYGIGVCDTFGSVRGHWNGYISNVKVYVGKALSAAEVLQNYNALAERYNPGIFPVITANVFPPYDPVYDEFVGVLYGPGQGTYMRQYTDKTVIVYNEIDEVTTIY
jgi:hypothetical protein